ncbi:MAG TPA: flavin reductase family protein [Gemmatimonadales bacterium]
MVNPTFRAVDAGAFRELMGSFATGVTVVTAMDPAGKPAGMTASAVAALSLVPPLLLVCVDHAADFHQVATTASVFGVNVLSEGQEALSVRFAEKGNDKFDQVRHLVRDGVPLLDGALAQIVCRRIDRIDQGDHTILIGEVTGGTVVGGNPLVHFRGAYRTTV